MERKDSLKNGRKSAGSRPDRGLITTNKCGNKQYNKNNEKKNSKKET